MRVQDIMTRKVETITPAEAVEAAVERMRQKRIRHLVVMRDGEVAGIVSDGDIRALPRGEVRSVEEVMTTPAVAATSNMTIRKAANLLRGRSIGCLPVMDGEDLVGIVTTTDLLERIGRGAERPVSKGKRWTLKGRGPRRKSVVGHKGFAGH
jgi:acetoin utilization protein AcuB